MNFIYLTTTFLLLFTSTILHAVDWEINYEKPECKQIGSSKIYGDITLLCNVSVTVRNLKVTIDESLLNKTNYSAKVAVVNENSYPVNVRVLLVEARAVEGEMIGYCSKDVELPLLSGESTKTEVRCELNIMPTGKTRKISNITVRASPWTGDK